jgi:trigger factor
LLIKIEGINLMSIEILDGLKRKAQFTINKKEVNELVKTELKKYAKDAKAPGFRPGKVPQNMVEQMYGNSAYNDALNDQINKKFVDLVIENKINLVGTPEFDLVNKEQQDAEDFLFAAIFEVMPEIKLQDAANYTVNKPKCASQNDVVDKAIDNLRKQRATYVVTENAAANENKVTIDFSGTLDNLPFDGGSANDYAFIIGKGQMLADFEHGVIGLKAGESKDVDVKFPDGYHAETLRGKTASFKISVKKVEQAQLPELTDEFIQSIGVADGTIETLKQEIKNNLDHEVKHRLHAKTRDNVFNALLTNNPLEVPHTLVHEEIHHMMDSTRENMKSRGYPEDKIKLTHDMFKDDAKRFVTLRLLVQQFIKENSVSVNDDEVKSVVADMATRYDDQEEYIKWYYSDKTRVNNARAIATENKVLELILSKAKITEVDVTYDELMK